MTTQTPTTLLYATDSYLRAFEAHVVATDGRAVALDQTAFYPGGGGQMADRGAHLLTRRAPLAVSGMSKRDDVVWHELAEDAGDAAHRWRESCRGARLGLPLSDDAHAYRAARPLRHDLQGLRRAGDRWPDVSPTGRGWTFDGHDAPPIGCTTSSAA